MNPQARKYLIKRLIEPIGVIGPSFERFGEVLFDHILSTALEHTGLNMLGFPIGRVLDSSSADGKVVAEYSADADYFTRGMLKAKKDLTHALSRRPNAQEILLIAAQPGRPQIIDTFVKTELAKPRMKGRSLRIWSAESIAEQLIDKILPYDSAVEELSTFLPILTEIWEEAARDRLFPTPDPRHQKRPVVSNEIHRRLMSETCIAIGGIAGSGKSDAAAAYGADYRENYSLLIWLDGDEVSRVEDLRATPLIYSDFRFGH
ncbi:hypothetical protein V6B08_17575 [Ferrovibrio sp. MS7]|uniref:hypothetical protein n=1 Tax=Ferrovibrio plantarum TaxID=3119164 RepID=UPI003135310A